jgi:hypothetical protein
MHVKYYASAGLNTESPYTETFVLIDPYMHIPAAISYSVWIVPGTVDINGDPIIDYPSQASGNKHHGK